MPPDADHLAEPAVPVLTTEQRRSLALECIAEYRHLYPGDSRDDERLLHVPYGGYELADLTPERKPFRAELLRRLSESAEGHNKEKVQPKS